MYPVVALYHIQRSSASSPNEVAVCNKGGTFPSAWSFSNINMAHKSLESPEILHASLKGTIRNIMCSPSSRTPNKRPCISSSYKTVTFFST